MPEPSGRPDRAFEPSRRRPRAAGWWRSRHRDATSAASNFPSLRAMRAASSRAGGVAGALGKAHVDMRMRRGDGTPGEQHGGQQMMQHGIAGFARKALFAETLRLVRLARIERCRRAANECLGGVIHRRIRARMRRPSNTARLCSAVGQAWTVHVEPASSLPASSRKQGEGKETTPPLPAPGNPYSPWHRRRRTCSCPNRSAPRPSSAARPDPGWR